MQNLVMWIGVLTAFVAASIAIGQYDIKRVLAFSTVSQLGFMVAAVGMGAWVAAMFHLLTHGVFKALLFLGAGSVIHGTHETQDMRKMGGLRKAMPTTYWTYIFGTLALAGIFRSGRLLVQGRDHRRGLGSQARVAGSILIASAVLTAFYMGRQIFLVFWSTQRDPSYHPHESGRIMTLPLIILAVGALIAGAMNLPEPLPGALWLEHTLEPVFEATGNVVTPQPFNPWLAGITVLLSVGAGYSAYLVYANRQWKKTWRDPLVRVLGVFFEGFEQRWYADEFYDTVVVRPFKATARFFARIVDPRIIDGAVHGAARLVGLGGRGLGNLESGYVRSYALVFLVGVIAVLGYVGFMMR